MTTSTQPQWLLERLNKAGFLEQIVYTGPLSRKPKGWRLVGPLAPAQAGD